MENQHRKILGYRELDEKEIGLMNEIKALAAEVGVAVEALKARGEDLDQRWIAIGATDLQKGFMALLRGVATPEGF